MLQTFSDSFNLTTGAIGTKYARTGYGFMPAGFIIFATGRTDTGDATGNQTLRGSLGMASSTSARWCAATKSVHNVTTSSTDKAQYSTAVLILITDAGAIEGLLDVDSFDADGLTFIVDDVFVTTARVTVWAFGDTTGAISCIVGGDVMPTATGNQDITPGAAYAPPSFVFLVSNYCIAPEPDLRTGGAMMIGVCDQDFNQFTIGLRALDAVGTSDTGKYFRTGQIIGVPTTAAGIGTCLVRAELSAWLSTGFRIHYTEVDATARRFGYMIVRSASTKALVGTFNVSSTLNAAVPITTVFRAQGGLILSSPQLAQSPDDTPVGGMRFTIGAFKSPTNRWAMAWEDLDNVGVTIVTASQEFDEVLIDDHGLYGLMDIDTIGDHAINGIMDAAAITTDLAGFLAFAEIDQGVVGMGVIAEQL